MPPPFARLTLGHPRADAIGDRPEAVCGFPAAASGSLRMASGPRAPIIREMTERQKQLIVATDGSPGAREALEEGLGLAREAGAAVTLVYVRQKPPAVLGDLFYQRSLSQELLRARAVLADAVSLAAEQGIE